MENSKIEWCNHTFNPFVGCTKVSPGCDNCYAESWAKRSGLVKWGAGEDRRRTGEDYWRQPIKWNRVAERDGVRRRVFCASLADVFDNQVPAEWRADLWRLIEATPHLDWLLLTKRPQNAGKMITEARRAALGANVADEHLQWPWPNVWLGTTAENQQEAERRIPHLLAVPARVRFLSCEPLLGPVDLTTIRTSPASEFGVARMVNALTGADGHIGPFGLTYTGRIGPRIDWVIAGGESGPGARAMHPDWARGLRDQCNATGVPYFFKQNGEFVTEDQAPKGVVLPTAAHRPWPDQTWAWRVGKKRAGALLDGVEWRQFPVNEGAPHG